jgi:hypothetical protein
MAVVAIGKGVADVEEVAVAQVKQVVEIACPKKPWIGPGLSQALTSGNQTLDKCKRA